MSEGPTLLQSCKSKRRYRTFEFAEKIRARCEEQRGVKLRVYWCSFCFGYHITRRERGLPGDEKGGSTSTPCA